jgi:hypothetical protein
MRLAQGYTKAALAPPNRKASRVGVLAKDRYVSPSHPRLGWHASHNHGRIAGFLRPREFGLGPPRLGVSFTLKALENRDHLMAIAEIFH